MNTLKSEINAEFNKYKNKPEIIKIKSQFLELLANSKNNEDINHVSRKFKNFKNIMHKHNIKNFNKIWNTVLIDDFRIRYLFNPIYNTSEEPVLSDIICLYKTQFKRNNKIGIPANVIMNMLPKYENIHRFFGKEVNASSAMKKMINLIPQFGDLGLLYFSSYFEVFYPISMIIANGRKDDGFFIFKQLYPYYLFILDERYNDNINFMKFFNKTNILPLSLQIMNDDLLSQFPYNEENMIKLRTIFYFSDYTNPEVKKYLEIYGLCFFSLSIYLPNLLHNKNRSNKPILQYLMNLSEKDILQRYQGIIDKYLKNYYKFIKESSISEKEKEIFCDGITYGEDRGSFVYLNKKNSPRCNITPVKPIITENTVDVNFYPVTRTGQILLPLIKDLFEKDYIGESLYKNYEQIKKDYPRTEGRIQRIFPENYKNVVDKLYHIIKEYCLEGIRTFGQDWFRPIYIGYIIKNGSIEEDFFRIFREFYPFYSFFSLETFYKISPLEFLKTIKILSSNFLHENDQYYNFKIGLFDPSASLIIKVYEINSIKMDDKAIIDKFREIYYFSVVTNQEVREYCSKDGIIFLYFSYFLPDLLFIDNLDRINNRNLGKFITKEIIYNYLSGIKDLKKKYEELIGKYYDKYKEWVYLQFIQEKVYTENDFQQTKIRKCENYNLEKNPEFRRQYENIIKYFKDKSSENIVFTSDEHEKLSSCQTDIFSRGLVKMRDIIGFSEESKVIKNVNNKLRLIFFSPIFY